MWTVENEFACVMRSPKVSGNVPLIRSLIVHSFMLLMFANLRLPLLLVGFSVSHRPFMSLLHEIFC